MRNILQLMIAYRWDTTLARVPPKKKTIYKIKSLKASWQRLNPKESVLATSQRYQVSGRSTGTALS